MTTSPLLDALLETAREGVWLLDTLGRTRLVNRRMAEMLGVEPAVMTGRKALDHVARLPTSAEGEELALVRPDGATIWTLVAARQVADGHLLMVSDLTERKAAEAALAHQAFHDALTGLPNRALFLDRLNQALTRRGRGPSDPAVLFVDIDRLKVVNDSLGHSAGDDLLRLVADRLRSGLRAGDTVARFGGDEFVLLCEEVVSPADALVVAERVAATLAPSYMLGDRELTLTASIGVAVATGSGDTADGLLRDADAAMYRAKESGGDRIQLFGDELRQMAITRLATRSDLRRAVDDGDLVIHYQPIVDLATARVVGMEALVRWQHPERGLVPPGEFIAVAEDNGLILPIGALVLSEACLQVGAWNRSHPDRPPLGLSVNLSARQLGSTGLEDLVGRALAEGGLDPKLLTLEITESVLMDDTSHNRATMAALKEQGVRLAVDDFGTGWSSLLYLRQFPIDLLKIDRSFVSGLGQGTADSAIVAGVVGLAKGLGLTAVAEGVENAAQVFALTELGCDQAQGYHWSPALPADEMGAWLETAWAPLPPPASSRERQATRVLVADDQRSLREMVKLVLELEGGFEVVAQAADGWEAVELARRHQPDLVLLDLVMPGMGGLQALPHVQEAAPAAKVVVLTSMELGGVDHDTVTRADGVFEKSVDLSVMAEQLAGLFAQME